jgi:hypothetical protein
VTDQRGLLLAAALGFAGSAGLISAAVRDGLLARATGGDNMNAETEAAIQNLGKAFSDTGELISIMKRIANSLVNIELHLEAIRPSNVQTVRGPIR